MKFIKIFLFAAMLAAGITGCAAHIQSKSARPGPMPLGKEVKVFQASSQPSTDSRQLFSIEEPKDDLTLKQVLSLALMKNPELAAFSWEMRAMEAKSLQAGLLPNPEIDIEVENLGGSGDFQGADVMETTIQLSQLIELGGKRRKRKRIADLEHGLAGWDYESKRLDVLTKATTAFVDVLAAQERLALSEKKVGLAEQVHNTVSEKVTAGKVSPVEETKTGIALSTSRIGLERAKRSLIAAKKILAAVWGSTVPVFKIVKGSLETVFPIPSVEQLTSLIDKHPDIARWAMEIEKQRAAVEYAKAGSIPDLTVSSGFRRINETDDSTFVLGVSIPLPFFNRNQGKILESRYRLARVKEEQKAAMVRITASLAGIYQSLSTAFLEAIAWKSQVLPGAQSAFESVKEGYRYGKFGLLDVLDAQRTLFEANSRYIETLAEYHKGVAEMERLTGTPLINITNFSGELKGDIK